jgi:NAD+ kinase
VRTIGIVANTQREAAVRCARLLEQIADQRDVATYFAPALAEALGAPARSTEESALGACDLVVALGGDGTLLSANRVASPHGTPILGIHVGGPASFGFLTETNPGGACEALEAVLDGRYRLEERLMVRGDVIRAGMELCRFHGLNELVVRAQTRMLKMRVTVNDTFIATYAADGIIVAAPTGSTAYNLAAGGPLVHPSVQALLLTPICPHTLNVRSLLTSVQDTIQVELTAESRDITNLTVDGQVGVQVEPGDCIRFQKSEHCGRFISLDSANFYKKVQTRLRLGERFGS